jgi:hypothetical protein
MLAFIMALSGALITALVYLWRKFSSFSYSTHASDGSESGKIKKRIQSKLELNKIQAI